MAHEVVYWHEPWLRDGTKPADPLVAGAQKMGQSLNVDLIT